MGLFFILFGVLPIALLYMGNKVLALILSITLAIYSLVKMHRKQPTGKIFTVITVVLIILKVFALPLDVVPYVATGKSALYAAQYYWGNNAVSDEPYGESLTYRGKEYVKISQPIRHNLGNRPYSCDIENTEMFEKTTGLLYKSEISIFNFLFKNGMGTKHTIYEKKDAPDNRVIYVDPSNYNGEIWCLKEYADTAIKTYTDKTNLEFFVIYEKDGVEKTKKLSPEIYDEIKKCIEKYNERDNTYFPVPHTESDLVQIDAYSIDKRFYYYAMISNLRIIDGKLYYRFDYAEYDCLRDLNFELD